MSERRKRKARELEAEAARMVAQVAGEIRELRPLGQASDFSLLLGARPRRGVLRYVLGFGHLIFAQARIPTEEQIRAWRHLHIEAEARRQEAARLSLPVLIGPNRVVGNRKHLDTARAFQVQGLTTPAEDRFIARLERFWNDYPEETTGIVGFDGAIRPLRVLEDGPF